VNLQYKLYENGNNDTSNVLAEVLKNRGIDDYNRYLNLDESVVEPYRNLDNIEEAVSLFMKHFNQKNKIGILVDEDPDGFCSAAMMYSYIKQMDSDYPVDYILHGRAKAHGLSDDVKILSDIDLLIIPDAGTNDKNEIKHINEDGIDILILDHHELEGKNKQEDLIFDDALNGTIYETVIVNNQMSNNYSNKNLCGAGVVYRFLQALDEENWNEFADDYLDLCALANISDVMDMRSFETRYFTDMGLLNIQNKCFKALVDAQDYSMGGKINIHNVQWYITPILNGMIRIGSSEEKELLFRAFIEQDEFFEYKKRKPAETIQESIYDRAARLCKNAKSRQDKQKEKCVSQIAEIAQHIPQENKVVMIDTSDILDNGLTGVVAIKIAEMFNKPCILLNKFLDKKTGKITYGGSARNIDNSPIDSFKDIVNSTNILDGRGHANAFGIVGLEIDKKDDALNRLNDILQDVEYDSTYRVDFIVDIDDVTVKIVTDLARLEDIIGQGIEEPMLAIENISLTKEQFEIFGKNEDTISFMIDEIKYIQFKCKEGNQLYDWLQNAWDENDSVVFNIVGKPSINEYNGVRTPQIIIEDVVVVSTNNSDNEEEW
jgi:single-stranded-DNA-specific exonuclease